MKWKLWHFETGADPLQQAGHSDSIESEQALCGGQAMPLEIKKSVKQMFDEAMSQVETWNIDQAKAALGKSDVTFIDLRDPREIWRDGGIPGAINVTRGMLEFWIDPGSPYAKPFFQTGNRFVMFCAGGVRSALAAKTAQDMGLTPVCHIEGGFGAWKKAGHPVETVEPKK
jgi:rhodanese-related sulfurtransferase